MVACRRRVFCRCRQRGLVWLQRLVRWSALCRSFLVCVGVGWSVSLLLFVSGWSARRRQFLAAAQRHLVVGLCRWFVGVGVDWRWLVLFEFVNVGWFGLCRHRRQLVKDNEGASTFFSMVLFSSVFRRLLLDALLVELNTPTSLLSSCAVHGAFVYVAATSLIYSYVQNVVACNT